MNFFHETVITDIQCPIVVHSQKGKIFQNQNRRYFGLSLCMSGQITYSMNDKSYISTPQNAVLLPQGASYRLHGDQEGLFPLINFSCTGLRCEDIAIFPLENPSACYQRFKTIQQLFLQGNNRVKIFSVFYDLLDQLFVSDKHIPRVLTPALEYISEHLQDATLSNDLLAEQMGISEVYLRKKFLSHFQITPKQYILNLRIEKAKMLLLNSAHSVTEISQSCGFSSVYHFCRAFKHRVGLTPTQFSLENKAYQI